MNKVKTPRIIINIGTHYKKMQGRGCVGQGESLGDGKCSSYLGCYFNGEYERLNPWSLKLKTRAPR